MSGANSERSIFMMIVGVNPKNKATKVYMNSPRFGCDKICVKIFRGSGSFHFNKMEKTSFNEVR